MVKPCKVQAGVEKKSCVALNCTCTQTQKLQVTNSRIQTCIRSETYIINGNMNTSPSCVSSGRAPLLQLSDSCLFALQFNSQKGVSQ